MSKDEIVCDNCGCSVADKSVIIGAFKQELIKKLEEESEESFGCIAEKGSSKFIKLSKAIQLTNKPIKG